jgi:hypothetical protein
MDHAEVLFRPEQSHLAAKHNQELREAQHRARQTHNAGAMIPAEAACFVSHIKALTIARAESIAAAYTAFNEAAGLEAERDLAEHHQNTIAVRKSVFVYQANLTAVRTGKPHPSQLPFAARGFEAESSIALQEGRKILAMQRVGIQNRASQPATRPGFVVDTCVFNWLADGKIKREALPSGGRFAITHIQLDEINKTKDEERRARLLLAHAALQCELIPTQTFVSDVSRLDHARLGNGELFKKIKAELDAANGRKKNNSQDALIAEAAIVNGYTLITADLHLKQATVKHGGAVLFFTSPDSAPTSEKA